MAKTKEIEIPSTRFESEIYDEEIGEEIPLLSPTSTNIRVLPPVDRAFLNARRKLLISCVLCSIFMVAEIIGGYLAGSLAIMTDAAHLLSDLASFVISLIALSVAQLPASHKLSYGYVRAEVIGALFSIFIVWVLTGILVYEAVHRVQHPVPVNGKLMFIIASAGLGINILMGLVLGHGHSHGPGGHIHEEEEEDHTSKKEKKNKRSGKHGHSHGSKQHKSDSKSAESSHKHDEAGPSHIHRHKTSHSHSHSHPPPALTPGDSGYDDDVDFDASQDSSLIHNTHTFDHGHSHSHGHGHGHSHSHGKGEREHEGNGDDDDDDDDVDGGANNDNDDDNEHEHHGAGHGHSHSHGNGGHMHSHGHVSSGDEADESHHSHGDDDDSDDNDGHESNDGPTNCGHSHSQGRELTKPSHSHSHSHGTKDNGHGHSHAHGGDDHDDDDDDDDGHGHSHGNHGHSHGHGHENVTVRAAFLHVIGDLIQSVGVMMAAALIWYDPKYTMADPICTFIFSLLVFITTAQLISEILTVLMEGTPKSVDTHNLRRDLELLEGVHEVHDLHVWSLTVGQIALSVHIKAENQHDTLIRAQRVCQAHGINHTTIQVECTPEHCDDSDTCSTTMKCRNVHT